MNLIDKILDRLTDRESMRSMLMVLFFFDVLLTTLMNMWSPSVDRLLMMFGMYAMLAIPVLVLYKDRHKAEEKVDA